MNILRLGRRLGLAFAGMAAFGLVQAQDISDSLLEEIIVTATKRAGGVEAQQVPVAITAFSAEQLDALHLRDLYAIGFAAPSVQMEDIGTTRAFMSTVSGRLANSSSLTISCAK